MPNKHSSKSLLVESDDIDPFQVPCISDAQRSPDNLPVHFNSKYDKVRTPQLVYNMGLLGLTVEQIAVGLGVSYEQLMEWMRIYPAVGHAVRDSRIVADGEVAKSLAQRAIGYRAVDEIEEIDPATGELVLTRRMTKDVPPDTKAGIHWLKVRQPEVWGDRQQGTEGKVSKLEDIMRGDDR